jgi:hypothetical protein
MNSPPSNASCVPAALFSGGPPFQAWKLAELPPAWQVTLHRPNTRYIGVELPDLPWGRAYADWFTANFIIADHGTWTTVCVVNMSDYHGGEGQRDQDARVLKFLLEAGKPPPNFLRILEGEVPGAVGLECHEAGHPR